MFQYYELSIGHFSSFLDAANEAAISRLYGGIHFRDAIVNGQQMGRQVGETVLKNLVINSKIKVYLTRAGYYLDPSTNPKPIYEE